MVVDNVRLGDVCNIIKGTKLTPSGRNSTSIRLIQIDDLRNDDNHKWCQNVGKVVFVTEKDIILAWDGANAGTVGFGLTGAIGSTLAKLKINSKFKTEFVGRYLQSKFAYLQKTSTGSTIPHIRRSSLENLRLPMYPLSEQNHIVKVLDTISTIIEKRKRQIAMLDELEKSLFIEMFGDIESINRWSVKRIGEIADVKVGIVIKPAQFYTTEDEGVRAFRSLNVHENKINDSGWVFISHEGNNFNTKSILKTGDVLVVRSGSPGKSCIVTEEYEGSNAIDLIIATPDKSLITSNYLCMYTNMPHGKEQINFGQNGVAQKHFNIGSFKKLKIHLPPMDIQYLYNSHINTLKLHRINLEMALSQMQETYNALMQQYFG